MSINPDRDTPIEPPSPTSSQTSSQYDELAFVYELLRETSSVNSATSSLSDRVKTKPPKIGLLKRIYRAIRRCFGLQVPTRYVEIYKNLKETYNDKNKARQMVKHLEEVASEFSPEAMETVEGLLTYWGKFDKKLSNPFQAHIDAIDVFFEMTSSESGNLLTPPAAFQFLIKASQKHGLHNAVIIAHNFLTLPREEQEQELKLMQQQGFAHGDHYTSVISSSRADHDKETKKESQTPTVLLPIQRVAKRYGGDFQKAQSQLTLLESVENPFQRELLKEYLMEPAAYPQVANYGEDAHILNQVINNESLDLSDTHPLNQIVERYAHLEMDPEQGAFLLQNVRKITDPKLYELTLDLVTNKEVTLKNSKKAAQLVKSAATADTQKKVITAYAHIMDFLHPPKHLDQTSSSSAVKAPQTTVMGAMTDYVSSWVNWLRGSD